MKLEKSRENVDIPAPNKCHPLAFSSVGGREVLRLMPEDCEERRIKRDRPILDETTRTPYVHLPQTCDSFDGAKTSVLSYYYDNRRNSRKSDPDSKVNASIWGDGNFGRKDQQRYIVDESSGDEDSDNDELGPLFSKEEEDAGEDSYRYIAKVLGTTPSSSKSYLETAIPRVLKQHPSRPAKENDAEGKSSSSANISHKKEGKNKFAHKARKPKHTIPQKGRFRRKKRNADDEFDIPSEEEDNVNNEDEVIVSMSPAKEGPFWCGFDI